MVVAELVGTDGDRVAACCSCAGALIIGCVGFTCALCGHHLLHCACVLEGGGDRVFMWVGVVGRGRKPLSLSLAVSC